MRLIVHERYQGRDDQRGSTTCDGGELVAEAFACARWHDQQDVAALGGGFADGVLAGSEFAESEDAVE